MAKLKNTTIDDNEFLQLPSGTAAQRPANPEAGMIRFNTDEGYVEWYDDVGDDWLPISTFPPVIATGGTVTDITQNGVQFRVHTFTSDGTFEVTRGGEVDVLVVAGGGSGAATPGQHKGGGGGAGGLVFTPNSFIGAGSNAITVGLGGASVGQTSSFSATQGNPGQDSIFNNLIALGGGRGGQRGEPEGSNDGGSGGGGHYELSGGSATQPTSSTGGFGNDGGSGGSDHGRGGGGAGDFGRNSNQGTQDGEIRSGAWSGGEGLSQVTINDTSYNFASMFGTTNGEIVSGQAWFAGGGGGGENDDGSSSYGAGGLGGGGRGAFLSGGYVGTSWGTDTSAGESALPNTGGGGGGSRQGVSGAGGSGIVIVRYRIG